MITRTVSFAGQLQEMAAQQVTAHIGQDRLAAIKARDAHPMFIGLKVAVEGFSNGELGEMGPQAKKWPGHTIEQLAQSLTKGDIGLYDAHVKEGVTRTRVGDVLSGFPQTENGLLHAYGVGYVAEEKTRGHIQEGKLDACSVEAEVVFSLQDGEWIVEEVKEASGIALANSTFQTPGFAGAGIVAVIQELQQLDLDAFLVANGIQPAAPAKPICTTDPFLQANRASVDGQLQSP